MMLEQRKVDHIPGFDMTSNVDPDVLFAFLMCGKRRNTILTLLLYSKIRSCVGQHQQMQETAHVILRSIFSQMSHFSAVKVHSTNSVYCFPLDMMTPNCYQNRRQHTNVFCSNKLKVMMWIFKVCHLRYLYDNWATSAEEDLVFPLAVRSAKLLMISLAQTFIVFN